MFLFRSRPPSAGGVRAAQTDAGCAEFVGAIVAAMAKVAGRHHLALETEPTPSALCAGSVAAANYRIDLNVFLAIRPRDAQFPKPVPNGLSPQAGDAVSIATWVARFIPTGVILLGVGGDKCNEHSDPATVAAPTGKPGGFHFLSGGAAPK